MRLQIPRMFPLSCCLVLFTWVANAATLKNILVIPGAALDRTQLKGARGGANINRLGGFGSDVYYDRNAKVFYGVADRGPGGGTIPFATRVQKFTLNIDPVTGAASHFKLLDTILFRIPAGKTVNGVTGPASFNGIDPARRASGGAARNNLGLSHDPEGFVVAPNGHFYVSDEYGPSIYEFLPDGLFVRAFRQPEQILPRDAGGPNFSALSAVTMVSGRQRNRGFEGLAISPDGRQVFALLQDPLSNEGSLDPACTMACAPPGRFSRNIRLIAYDATTGESTAQYVYQLESLTSINARVAANPFGPNAQGVNIGIGAMAAISNHEFLVLERDNRGVSIDDPASLIPVSTKRIYRIDVARATDVSRISLDGSNTLPPGVVPVAKSLFMDLAAELKAREARIPEKIEGLTIGPRLSDGTYELLVATDNDFSVTQNDAGIQFDVCTNGRTSQQVPIDAGCPSGMSLLPTYFLSFKTDRNEIDQFSRIAGCHISESKEAAVSAQEQILSNSPQIKHSHYSTRRAKAFLFPLNDVVDRERASDPPSDLNPIVRRPLISRPKASSRLNLGSAWNVSSTAAPIDLPCEMDPRPPSIVALRQS